MMRRYRNLWVALCGVGNMCIGVCSQGQIAKDDFDSPVRLIQFSQTPAVNTFQSADDAFQVYQIGEGRVPGQLVDNSHASGDSLGIVDRETKTDRWFGVSDTRNDDNPAADGLATALWQFDVAGFQNLTVAVDVGAMGDFEEEEDVYNWLYSFTNSNFLPLWTSRVNESGTHSYTLADGTVAELPDPLMYDTVVLNNTFQTLTRSLSGSGSVLYLRLEAIANGGTEAYAFDNIRIDGVPTGGPACDLNADAAVDASDMGIVFGSWGRPGVGDLNRDSVVDAADAGACFGEWTGDGVPAGTGQPVPEPGPLGWLATALWGARWPPVGRRRQQAVVTGRPG